MAFNIVTAKLQSLERSSPPKDLGRSASLENEDTKNLRALDTKNPLAKFKWRWICAASDFEMVPLLLTDSSMVHKRSMRPSLLHQMKDPLLRWSSRTDYPKSVERRNKVQGFDADLGVVPAK